jgi:Transposase DDE domain
MKMGIAELLLKVQTKAWSNLTHRDPEGGHPGRLQAHTTLAKDLDSNRGRLIAIYLSKPIDHDSAGERMKGAIDSERCRRLYSLRVGTVGPVFANFRHHKSMNRFTVRGKTKVTTQGPLYCLVHIIKI